jgi:hypothetical protein
MISPQLPDYGVYAWWPEAGHAWIHPDDVALVTQLIPSDRVFRRERFDGVYYHLCYDQHRCRVRPSMWLKVPYEGFDCGEEVEVLSDGMMREPFVGVILEMHYQRSKGKILYTLRRADVTLPQQYLSGQFRKLDVSSR